MYTSQVTPPFMWWVVGLGFGATFVIAIGAYLPEWGAWSVAIGVLAIVTATIVGFRASVRVTPEGIRSGHSMLEWPYVGDVVAMRRDEVKREVGVAADPRAFLAYRGYADEAVRIMVADRADPHPYWLLSCANSAELARQIDLARPREDT